MSNYVNPKISISLIVIAVAVLFFWFMTQYDTETFTFQKPKHEVKEEPVITSLFFAGDIMLSRNVASAIYKAQDNVLPFRQTLDTIKNADIAFANLESPFNSTGDHSVEGSLIFNADPTFVEGLTNAGFDVLSTANNHSFDQGEKGIELTQSTLINARISPVGTGNTKTGLNCHDGTIIVRDGMKFGFLAYSYAAKNDGGKIPDPLVCDWNDEKQIIEDITVLKSEVDFLIISAHMGVEYQREPEEINATRARKLIDAGADMIVGHHPHWIQTVEQYNGKWIFYSLGNFVFDQMWSQDTREGLTLLVTFENKDLKQIELRPVLIDNFCCPKFPLSIESAEILKKINLTSPYLMNKN